MAAKQPKPADRAPIRPIKKTKPKKEERSKAAFLVSFVIGVGLCLQFNRPENLSLPSLWPLPWPRPSAPQIGEIRWHSSCGERTDSNIYECGTLYTPLDYTNSTDPRLAEIAIVRYKAGAGKTNREDVLGSLIMNPGGPGESGHVQIMERSSKTDEVLEGKYDLVSFDTRGVGYTWPKVQCFDNATQYQFHKNVVSAYGYPGQHGPDVQEHELGYIIATHQLLADKCKTHPDSELFEYMSTMFIIRDMKLLHEALGDEKLNYWGFSYGTVIGATYAATFPDDINRLVLDGLVHMYDYYNGRLDAMIDPEPVFEQFFIECARVGSEKCKLALLNSDGTKLQKTVVNWLEHLKTNPVPVVEAQPPRILTYGDIMATFDGATFNPSVWSDLAENLYEAIEHKNYTGLLSDIDLNPSTNVESEAYPAIACSDINTDAPNSTWSIPEFAEVFKPGYKRSPGLSIFMSELTLMCGSSWPFRGAERFTGSFKTNTSFPILLVGNDYDPVTPGKHADTTSEDFEGSVSVRRGGFGHCSYSQPSKCFDKILFNYFINGELPAKGTHCEVDSSPYDKV